MRIIDWSSDVCSSDLDDRKIPGQERLLSAGAACFALLQAAQALGFGANWLTGWPAHDPQAHALLGMGEHERVVGFVHIGTPMMEVPERERPDAAALPTDWTPRLARPCTRPPSPPPPLPTPACTCSVPGIHSPNSSPHPPTAHPT